MMHLYSTGLLVVMEKERRVLILVVMDDALVLGVMRYIDWEVCIVLILVVMDDALVQAQLLLKA